MRKRKYTLIPLILALVMGLLAGCSGETDTGSTKNNSTVTAEVTVQSKEEKEAGGSSEAEKSQTEVAAVFSLSEVPAYSDSPYAVVNDNKPFFTSSEITATAYEKYSDLDSLGRCGAAIACIDKSLMPTGERGSIGQVKPTGWHTVKYDCVDGKYLYNRCHLLGWQLTGENANEKNLITGTRYLNVDGMLPFENMVADYIKETNNHVIYRVTPVFEEDNLLASGVLMEAFSVEDNGSGIEFCVYGYNVQPGVKIAYSTGDSELIEVPTEAPTEAPTVAKTEAPAIAQTEAPAVSNVKDYVLNTSTKKFHLPTCSRKPTKNRSDITCTRDELISQGYSPCSYCDP